MKTRALLVVLLCGCAPSFTDAPWLVVEPRVIAITAEPPEVAPGERASLTAVIAGAGELGWARCDVARPLSQNEPVALACLEQTRLATPAQTTFELTVPATACATFGPDVVAADDRPRDPDASGGYYQPVGVTFANGLTFAFQRLTCDPPGVTNAVAQQFRSERQPNHNPRVALAPVAPLRGGESVELWAQLDAPEAYVRIDQTSFTVTRELETLTVSWFVTAGTLSPATGVNVRWVAPAGVGTATVWAVARDSRGGLAVAQTELAWQ